MGTYSFYQFLTAYLCIYSFVNSEVHGTFIDSLLPGNSNDAFTNCSTNMQCNVNTFCFGPSQYSGAGSCLPCWRCCLFPELFGSCPASCGCEVGRICGGDAECICEGLFCSQNTNMPTPVCQTCLSCLYDSDALGESCAHACASGALTSASILSTQWREWVYLSFLLRDGILGPVPELPQEPPSGLGSPPLMYEGRRLAALESISGSQGRANVREARDLLAVTVLHTPPEMDGLVDWSAAAMALDPELLQSSHTETYVGRASRTPFLSPPSLQPPEYPRSHLDLSPPTLLPPTIPSMETLPHPPPMTEADYVFSPPPPGTAVLASPPDGAEAEFQVARDVIMSSTSSSLVCPFLNSTTGHATTRVTLIGCPCNFTTKAATLRCPLGAACSRRAGDLVTAADLIKMPGAVLLGATCIACQPGQTCPEGTLDAADGSGVPPCPAGFYCPNASTILPCPPGTYCVAGSSQPTTCNYNTLLDYSPFLLMPLPPVSAVERVRNDGDPLDGNFCPASATLPYTLCSAGYYCPNVSTQLLCPAGHFCKAQSTAPTPCPPLTRCPAGTANPALSGLAFVTVGAAAIGTLLMLLIIRTVDKAAGPGRKSTISESFRPQHKRMSERLLATSVRRHGAGAASGRRRGLADVRAPASRHRGFEEIEIQPAISLATINLGLTVKQRDERVTVLSGVRANFPAAQLHAVMGPSGCGKTSLLGAISGRTKGQISGVVLANGCPANLAQMSSLVGYVPQDDCVHEELTVSENLKFSCSLKLRSGTATRAGVTSAVLSMLGLKDVADVLVGSMERRCISGGQRKRLNIGVELVGLPSVLLCDEPTSGLDAASGADILLSLADIAELGATVVAVIHAPRYLSLLICDSLLLLGAEGRTVYAGPPGIAQLYFQHGLGFQMPLQSNPADTLIDIVAGRITRTGEPLFKPPVLADWWADAGPAWLDSFRALNPCLLGCGVPDHTTVTHVGRILDEMGISSPEALVGPLELAELFSRIGSPVDPQGCEELIRQLASRNPAAVSPADLRPRAPSPEHPGTPQTSQEYTLQSHPRASPGGYSPTRDGARDHGHSGPGTPDRQPRVTPGGASSTRNHGYVGSGSPDRHHRATPGRASPNKDRGWDHRPTSPTDLERQSSTASRTQGAGREVGGKLIPSGSGLRNTAGGLSMRGAVTSPGSTRTPSPEGSRVFSRGFASGLRKGGNASTATPSPNSSDSGLGVSRAVLLAAFHWLVDEGATATAAAGSHLNYPAMTFSTGDEQGPGLAKVGDSNLTAEWLDKLKLVSLTSASRQHSRGIPVATAHVALPQSSYSASTRFKDMGSKDSMQRPAATPYSAARARAFGLPAGAEPLQSGTILFEEQPSHESNNERLQWSAREARIEARRLYSRSNLAATSRESSRTTAGVSSPAQRTSPTKHGPPLSRDPSSGRQSPELKSVSVLKESPSGRWSPDAKPASASKDSPSGRRSPEMKTASASPSGRWSPDPKPASASKDSPSGRQSPEGKPASAMSVKSSFTGFKSEESLVSKDPRKYVSISDSGAIGAQSVARKELERLPKAKTFDGRAHTRHDMRGYSGSNIRLPSLDKVSSPFHASETKAEPPVVASNRRDPGAKNVLEGKSEGSRSSSTESGSVETMARLPADFFRGSMVSGLLMRSRSSASFFVSSPRKAILEDTPTLDDEQLLNSTTVTLPPPFVIPPYIPDPQAQSPPLATGPSRAQPDSLLDAFIASSLEISPTLTPQSSMPPSSSSVPHLPETPHLEPLCTLPESSSSIPIPPKPPQPPPQCPPRDSSASILDDTNPPQISPYFQSGSSFFMPEPPPPPSPSTPTPPPPPPPISASSDVVFWSSPLASPRFEDDYDIESSLPSWASSVADKSSRLSTAPVGDLGSSRSHTVTNMDSTQFASHGMYESPLVMRQNVGLSLSHTTLETALLDAETTMTNGNHGARNIVSAISTVNATDSSGFTSGASPIVEASHASQDGQVIDWPRIHRSGRDELRPEGGSKFGELEQKLWLSQLPCKEPEDSFQYQDPLASRSSKRTPDPLDPRSQMPSSLSNMNKPSTSGHHWNSVSSEIQPEDSACQHPQTVRHGHKQHSRFQSMRSIELEEVAGSNENYVHANARSFSIAGEEVSQYGYSSFMTDTPIDLRDLEHQTSHVDDEVGYSDKSEGLITVLAAALWNLSRSVAAAALSPMTRRSRSSGGSASKSVSQPPPTASSYGGYSIASTTQQNIQITQCSVTVPAHSAQSPTISIAKSSPSFIQQFSAIFVRAIIKYVRTFWPMRVMDVGVLSAAALVVGAIQGTAWNLPGVPTNMVMVMVVLAVLVTVTFLRTFSTQQLLFKREAAGGMSTVAYCLAHNIVDLLWLVIAPAVFLGPYYYMTLLRMRFFDCYGVALAVSWWASGAAYLVSGIVPQNSVLVVGICLVLVLGAFVTGLTPTLADVRGTVAEGLLGLSYNRWAMELLSILEMQNYMGNLRNVILQVGRGIGLCELDLVLNGDGQGGLTAAEAVAFLHVQQDMNLQFCDPYKRTAYLVLWFQGLAWRLLAFFATYLLAK